jgi:hypothetical protein
MFLSIFRKNVLINSNIYGCQTLHVLSHEQSSFSANILHLKIGNNGSKLIFIKKKLIEKYLKKVELGQMSFDRSQPIII